MIEEITIRIYPIMPDCRELQIDVIRGKTKSLMSKLIQIEDFTAFYDQIMDDIVREMKQEILNTKPKP